MVFAATALAPQAAHAANTCNAFIAIDYPLEPVGEYNLPGDVVRVKLTLGTGSINGGTLVTINKIRFEMDCNSNFALGINCTDEGPIMEYQGDGTITTDCVGINFTTDGPHGVSTNPNQLAFVASPAFTIPPNTADFCSVEFDVKVLQPGTDPTPTEIQEVAGFDNNQGDAQCNNGLSSGGSQSGSVFVCPTCTDTECSTFACNQQNGMCEPTPKDPSTPCGDTDNNACTTAGCDDAGNCSQTHMETVCQPDTNDCTDDSPCNPQSGLCEHPPKASSTPCTDNDTNACTTAGCDGQGTCNQSHITKTCDDNNVCTNDRCVPATGGCVNTDNGTCGGGEGCTPGYWKQSQHFGSWTAPYTPSTQFSAVFEDAFPGKTLLQVLQQGGGGLIALGRHTVAALLNAASPDVDSDLTAAEVIARFNAVFPGGDYEKQKNEFANFNEQRCPLGRNP